eukprot:GHRQ01021292.1.p1 GENE.GHRQ01021292.1~~GHRQ01021292.1.p1  ORF type:complete len:263 (+),score=95.33 GHRQ01021292.1:88-876(+)
MVAALGAPLAHLDMQARVAALNKMLRSGKVQVFKQGQTLLYKAAQPQEIRTKGLSAEELLVYQVIKQAGNTGVWTRDLKVRTNLAQPQVTKMLKALEGKSLIKSVKNVNNPSRKLYMLFELEPSREITGGAWYTDQQLDREFIEVLRETCFRLVERSESPHICLADIANFINAKGLARVELREEDILTIMETLIADGRSVPTAQYICTYCCNVRVSCNRTIALQLLCLVSGLPACQRAHMSVTCATAAASRLVLLYGCNCAV